MKEARGKSGRIKSSSYAEGVRKYARSYWTNTSAIWGATPIQLVTTSGWKYWMTEN